MAFVNPKFYVQIIDRTKYQNAENDFILGKWIDLDNLPYWCTMEEIKSHVNIPYYHEIKFIAYDSNFIPGYMRINLNDGQVRNIQSIMSLIRDQQYDFKKLMIITHWCMFPDDLYDALAYGKIYAFTVNEILAIDKYFKIKINYIYKHKYKQLQKEKYNFDALLKIFTSKRILQYFDLNRSPYTENILNIID